MARPQKDGMDYFPHDVYASSDEKIEPLLFLYGASGYAFYFIHLEYIYRNKNFEFDISDAETIQILSSKLRISCEEYAKILQTALKHDCFDKMHFEKTGCLTSDGVKKRAKPVIDKRENMRKDYEKKQALVSDAEIPPETHIEKESKVKERKEIKDSCSEPKKNGTEHFLPEHHSTPEKIPYSQIIRVLNSTCGCDYKPSTISTRQHIKARWSEGWRMEDFEAVIVGMRSKWANDPKMCQYLRPQTLFGTKFESYLQVVKNGSTTTTSGDIKCNHCRYRASDVCKGKSEQQRATCGSFCKEEVAA